MIKTNLILVDGLPGSGKSTTAQQLCTHLLQHGHKARWYFEHQATHPIYVNTELMLAREAGNSESNRIHEKALFNWTDLVRSTETRAEIGILEGTLFQMGAGSQLLMNWDPGEIAGHASRVEKLIEKLNPVLIYLYQTEIADALKRISQQRGRWFEEFLIKHIGATPYGTATSVKDFQGVTEVFKVLREITDSLFAKLTMRKLAVDTSAGDWLTYCEEISRFLLVPLIERPSFDPLHAKGLMGKYRQPDSGDEFVIQADANGLFFSDESKTRLIRVTDSVFIVQAMNIELTFERDTQGIAHKVNLSGDLPNLPYLWVKV
jgi:thymidylate kinase